MLCDHPLEHYINGPAHHTLHHLYFTCNYGQYFTWADKAFSSFRVPAKGDDPLVAVLAGLEKKRQAEEDAEAERLRALKAPEMKRIDSGLGSEVDPESPAPSSPASSDRESSVERSEMARPKRIAKQRTSTASATSGTDETLSRPRREGLRSRK